MDNQNPQKIDPDKPDNRKSRSNKDSISSAANIPQTADTTDIQTPFSSWRFLIITIGGVFLAEVVAMIFIYRFPNLPYYQETLIDASLMVILIFPIVYIFSLKPLLLHIEKRQRTEIALRQSEERFAIAYRSNPAALSMTRAEDGRFIEVNNSFLRQSGYTRNEVIGHTSDELNLYPDLDEREKLKWLLLKQGSVDNFEMMTRIKSGEIRNISVSTEAIELGGEVNILAIASDITERKQAEAAIQRASAYNRRLIEAALDPLVTIGPNGKITDVNTATENATGCQREELIGANFSDYFTEPEKAHAGYEQVFREGFVRDYQLELKNRNGGVISVLYNASLYKDKDGKVQGVFAAARDITERKRVEERLQRANLELQNISREEHKQRQLSEALVEAALVLNKSMKLDEVLPLILEQIKEVIPYQLANITMLEGESFYDASHKGDQRWQTALAGIKNRFPLEDFPLLRKMRQSGQPVLILDTVKEPDWVTVNGLEWCLSFLSAPLLAENQVIGFVNLFAEQPGFFTTEMQDRLVAFASHAAVAIQNAWLFEQVRAGSDRLHSLSHRLVEIQENERLYIARELHDEAGQMLTSLMLDLRMLETQASQPDAILKKVAEMERALNAVSENLHSVAMALRPATLDHLGLVPALRQHVESVGEKYRLKASFRSGKFRERLPANMETELYRIVQEALTNVVRHAHASQVDVILTMRGNKLIVIVEDNGKGFNPGQVSDTHHLGLFGMRERAEMIGGKLVIESAPGKGTTVIVEVSYADSITDRG